jgi:hypothetical protein
MTAWKRRLGDAAARQPTSRTPADPVDSSATHRRPRRLPSIGSRAATALVLLAAALPASSASAAIEAGVEFGDRAIVERPGGEARLELCATALLRYRLVFKGFAVAYYRDDCERASDVPRQADTPQRLELAYFWPIDGRRFGPAAEEVLRRNLDEKRFAALEPRLRRLHAAYRSVEPGDRYALTYLPGRGTELSLNDRPLALIDGEDFARAYFDIWLGEDPIDAGLRDALLRRPTSR